ncbi:MAG: phage holin family protein [Atopobiaceae bacterium]|nr:phage holin family protein [Atopobiaceae bacterium]
MSFILTWLSTAVAAAVATWVLPGLVPMGETLSSILIFALAIALVNASIRPIMHTLSMPLTVLTLGIFHLVVNGVALLIASWLSTSILGMGVYVVSFWDALLGSIIISIVSSIVGGIVGADD